MNDIEIRIQEALADAGLPDATLEHPTETANGDFATNAALAAAAKEGVNPRALAEEAVQKLKLPEGVARAEVAGPGFINFYLAPSFFMQTLAFALAEPDVWGRGSSFSGRRVMVEYTQPNPFKEFHIGHLMSNTIGESISRLIENAGADVKRANYQGDIGPHVAKAIWGMRKLGADPSDIAMVGRAYAAGAKAYAEDPAVKAEIDELNQALYQNRDPELERLYQDGREASLAHFEEIYKKLGTKFDYYFFESETAPIGQKLVEAHPEVFPESDSARVYRGEADGLHTRVFITSRGLPTYEVKEIGLMEQKRETWNFDISITVTASEQTEFFKVVRAAYEKIRPEYANAFAHVAHGMMRLPTGKMSSRTGDIISGEAFLAEVTEAVREKIRAGAAEVPEDVAEHVAVGAIKYIVLRQDAGKDITFDPAHALSFEGASGPYLQYTHARARAVLSKAGNADIRALESEPNEIDRLLYRFPEVAEKSAASYEPHHLATYLIELAAAFNSWYAKEKILDGTEAQAGKLAVTSAVATTLARGLSLLGIPAPEQM